MYTAEGCQHQHTEEHYQPHKLQANSQATFNIKIDKREGQQN